MLESKRPTPPGEALAKDPANLTANEVNATPNIVQAALALAQQGWAVFPLNGKRPFSGFHWPERSSADPQTIQQMFAAHPHSNIGVDCGKSGLFVIDLDMGHGQNGVATWNEIQTAHGIDSAGGAVVSTGGGGWHLIFRDPTGGKLGNTAGKLGSGIDTRGRGGYIVAPPSRHPETGRCYRWERPQPTPADVPAALISLLLPTVQPAPAPSAPDGNTGRHTAYVRAILDDELRELSRAPAGTRNARLFQTAARLGELVAAPWAGLTQAAVESALYDACRTNGLVQEDGERSVRATLSSGLQRGLSQPRPEPQGTPPASPPTPAPTPTPPPVLLTAPDSEETPLPDGMAPLPSSAQLDPALGQAACPWLDAYCAFSAKWSPEAYPGYHPAAGLWVLSTVAARRVGYHFGGLKHPSLYILLTARSGLTSKTTTTQVAIKVLQAAQLDFLLATMDATPQRFVNDLVIKAPADYAQLTPEQQADLALRLGFAGQRGWYYDEFGAKIKAMLRENSVMADFFRLLLVFHEGEEAYEYRTQGRIDRIERPYLALLGNATPANLQKVAQRGSELWGDGFLARFALIAPPADYAYASGRFPQERMEVPESLTAPLCAWHRWLSVPQVQIDAVPAVKGEPQEYRVAVQKFPCHELTLAHAAFEAFYTYREALRGLISQSQGMDLDSYYIRLPEKALRIAALFASLAGGDAIELRHWARAQSLAEDWRASIHHLYAQLTSAQQPSAAADLEDRILQIIRKLTAQGNAAPTANEIRRYLYQQSVTELTAYLQKLCKAGVLRAAPRARETVGYALVAGEN